MTLKTLTRTEERWRRRARQAVERSEEWERCDECSRFHPTDYDGGCDDAENRLPRPPAELVGRGDGLEGAVAGR